MADTYQILVVDDDFSIVNIIETALKQTGYQVLTAYDGETACHIVNTKHPHLIIMDVMMPQCNGIIATMRIRENNNVPILMLSAKAEGSDRVLGLEAGADDYLVKPFGIMEMVSRVKAVLRRAGNALQEKRLRAGEIVISPEEHTVLVKEQKVQLTLKEFELLRLFVERPGHVFTREKLLLRIWGSDFVGETRTVDVHIGTLRGKLGESGAAIETVRGVGYRLVQ